MSLKKSLRTKIAHGWKCDKKPNNGFIPLERIGRARFESDVLLSQMKRVGIKNPKVTLFSCRCGSKECLASPIAQNLSDQDKHKLQEEWLKT